MDGLVAVNRAGIMPAIAADYQPEIWVVRLTTVIEVATICADKIASSHAALRRHRFERIVDMAAEYVAAGIQDGEARVARPVEGNAVTTLEVSMLIDPGTAAPARPV